VTPALKRRITIVAGSIIGGWEEGLRTLTLRLLENNHVDIVLEEVFAPIAARVLGDYVRKIRLHVLGSKRRGFEEKIIYVYSNAYPDLLILLYRPGINNDTYVDENCIRVPHEAIGAENIVKLANHSNTPTISIIRYCSNLGASLINREIFEECECPSTDNGFKIDYTIHAPTPSSIRSFLEEKREWFL